MVFQPDILVTGQDGIGVILVVETKTILTNLQHTEEALKLYMIQMSCPIGLLITPEQIWLYRDSYTSRLPQSIQRIGVFNAKPLWREPVPTLGAPFEQFVQRWLEGLSKQPARELPKELREYVLPAVATGDIRAAHPRYS
jgi:hypothetical protein